MEQRIEGLTATNHVRPWRARGISVTSLFALLLPALATPPAACTTLPVPG